MCSGATNVLDCNFMMCSWFIIFTGEIIYEIWPKPQASILLEVDLSVCTESYYYYNYYRAVLFTT